MEWLVIGIVGTIVWKVCFGDREPSGSGTSTGSYEDSIGIRGSWTNTANNNDAPQLDFIERMKIEDHGTWRGMRDDYEASLRRHTDRAFPDSPF